MLLSRDILVKQLKVISHAYFRGFGAVEQTVIIAFSAPHTVARPVICHSRNNNKLYPGYIHNVISLRFLNMECSQCHS